MPGKLFGSVLSVAILGACLAAGSADAQPRVGGAAEGSPEKALADACFAPYGLKPAEKVQICSKALESGTLKSVGLALAYYNRASAYAGSGEQSSALDD